MHPLAKLAVGDAEHSVLRSEETCQHGFHARCARSGQYRHGPLGLEGVPQQLPDLTVHLPELIRAVTNGGGGHHPEDPRMYFDGTREHQGHVLVVHEDPSWVPK